MAGLLVCGIGAYTDLIFVHPLVPHSRRLSVGLISVPLISDVSLPAAEWKSSVAGVEPALPCIHMSKSRRLLYAPTVCCVNLSPYAQLKLVYQRSNGSQALTFRPESWLRCLVPVRR